MSAMKCKKITYIAVEFLKITTPAKKSVYLKTSRKKKGKKSKMKKNKDKNKNEENLSSDIDDNEQSF